MPPLPHLPLPSPGLRVALSAGDSLKGQLFGEQPGGTAARPGEDRGASKMEQRGGKEQVQAGVEAGVMGVYQGSKTGPAGSEGGLGRDSRRGKEGDSMRGWQWCPG